MSTQIQSLPPIPLLWVAVLGSTYRCRLRARVPGFHTLTLNLGKLWTSVCLPRLTEIRRVRAHTDLSLGPGRSDPLLLAFLHLISASSNPPAPVPTSQPADCHLCLVLLLLEVLWVGPWVLLVALPTLPTLARTGPALHPTPAAASLTSTCLLTSLPHTRQATELSPRATFPEFSPPGHPAISHQN